MVDYSVPLFCYPPYVWAVYATFLLYLGLAAWAGTRLARPGSRGRFISAILPLGLAALLLSADAAIASVAFYSPEFPLFTLNVIGENYCAALA